MHSSTSFFTVKWGTPYPWQLWWWFMLIPTVTCCFGSILHMFIHIIIIYVYVLWYYVDSNTKNIWTCLHALMANQWQRYFLWTDSIDCSFTTGHWIDCLINVLRVDNFSGRAEEHSGRCRRDHWRGLREGTGSVEFKSSQSQPVKTYSWCTNYDKYKVSKVDDKRWRGIVTLNPSQERYPKKRCLGPRSPRLATTSKASLVPAEFYHEARFWPWQLLRWSLICHSCEAFSTKSPAVLKGFSFESASRRALHST